MSDAINQRPMAGLICHMPIRPARQSVIGEVVFLEYWQALMQREFAGHDWSDYADEPEETAVLRHMLLDLPGQIDQRVCSVAASFIKFLGCNCGLGILQVAQKFRRDGWEHPTLMAWTLDNRRRIGINSGVRTIEAVLAERAHRSRDDSHVAWLPDLSLRDAEVIEHLCDWLDTAEGQRFLDSARMEIDRRRNAIEALRREQADPLRQRAESLAAHMEKQLGVPCDVRRWHDGFQGWFVVRRDTYEKVADVAASVSTGHPGKFT